jgi:hypothetical protein
MKFILFVEGETERSLSKFLKKWLDPQLTSKIGIQTVKFYGFGEFIKDLKRRAELHLREDRSEEIIAIIGLLDIYGLDIQFPDSANTVKKKIEWATAHFENIVSNEKFMMFFAVHETEAWLLSEPRIFQKDIRNEFPVKFSNPESVNFNEPPSVQLDRIYRKHLNQKYRKVLDGSTLFERLDPNVVYQKCPNFKRMMDTLLDLAKKAEN